MKRRFADLVDIDQFAAMMRSFYEATGIPYGLIDTDNQVLCGMGWQNICTNFHRVNGVSLKRCHESDHYIADRMHEAPFIGYKCGNGLIDYAAPIVIDGEHVATLFNGQFFHEPPDVEFFRAQAERDGHDVESYLAALAKVPVIPKAQAEAAMAFLSKMAEMLATVGIERSRHLKAQGEVVELSQALRDRKAANKALAEEIAKEKLTEQELRRERDFSNAVTNSLPGIFYLLDTEGRFVMWNRNMEKLLGYSAEELNRFPAIELFRGVDRDIITERIGKVFHEGEANAEATIIGKDGHGTPHIFTGLRVVLDGTPYLVGVGLDITDRLKDAEALEEKATALQRSNEELEQFAYVASHDLREPLRMVTSYITLLERRYASALDKEGHEFISFAREGALRMDRLILDLLEYARVGRGHGEIGEMDSGDAAERAIANLEIAIGESGATVEITTPLPVVRAHADELTRLFQNIVGNAIKYRRPDTPPRIRISCEEKPSEHLFTISDNGIGIEPQYAERIFMIFQRLHTRQQYDGTGIGLAVCKKIAERHGGRLWMRSVPGEGTSFFFTLPRPRRPHR